MDSPQLMTVAETSVFCRKASELVDQEEHDALLDFLADNPEADFASAFDRGSPSRAPRLVIDPGWPPRARVHSGG